MNRARCILLFMLAMPFIAGFDWGRSKVDSIQGIWKSETPIINDMIWFLEVGKDYIIFGDDREDGLILEEKEGVVLIRKAGLNEAFARFVMRDDNRLVFELGGRKFYFVRSSVEDRHIVFFPPVENIAGSYRSQDGATLFEFSENDVVKDGVSLGFSVVGGNQKYFAVVDDIIQFGLTPAGEGMLEYRETPYSSPVMLFKVTQEEAGAILGNKAVESGKMSSADPVNLQTRVEFANFSATIPGSGGDLRPLNFNMVLELRYIPEEKRPGAARPTPAQIEVFRTVVVQLESKIRDHMNTFLTGQSFASLAGDRGPEPVKAEVKRFVNNELAKYDFERQGIPKAVSNVRVTTVFLPAWTLM